ncbi:riboflavin synthase subunit beta [uncultured Maribacter sp.]|uniref:riboflavin synthase subunit beta n=1 Tax=uncultured Maribacter sp. TaxID=431308 RepID=UPI002637E27A|nr:riboflavin synthase subunit beta [uncultured Maribacter sp.]
MGMLSKITKLGKNKKFGYSPRFYDDKGEGNPYEIEHKFDKFRSTVGRNRGLKRKFNNVLDDVKREGDRNLRKRMVIILAVLILIFLFIIDFDLSIFIS